MSDYGRANGPYPDRPSDPWGQDDPYPTPGPPFGPSEQYGRPPAQYQPDLDPDHRRPGGHPQPDPYQNPDPYQAADPYQNPDPYRNPAGYRQPGEHRPDEPGAAGGPWQPSGPRPVRRSSTGLVITLVAVLVAVLCGGGGLALYLMHKDSAANAQHRPPAPTAGSKSTAAASPSFDPRSIIKGQCVANDGTEDAPKLRAVTCAPGSYLVLARIDGTHDPGRCSTVAGSTHDYYYQTTPSTLDFLLCLKKQ